MDEECKESSIGHMLEIIESQPLIWDDSMEVILVKVRCDNCKQSGTLRYVEEP